MPVVASAPAKIILFGEHFVVYGEPAIVVAIDKRARVQAEKRNDKRLYIKSENLKISGYYENSIFRIETGDPREARMKFEPVKLITEKILHKYGSSVGISLQIDSAVPVGAGLGSSAAVAAATTAAVSGLLDVKLSREDILRSALEAEKTMHGTPSGVDPAIATFGGTLLFQMETGFKPVETRAKLPLAIGNTGVVRSTRIQVEKVRTIVDRYPKIVEPLMKCAREIVLRAIEALKENDLETIGTLMDLNHALLYGVGVSDESLEWLINAARKAGSLGAKLTGAGGGGCMIALASEERIEQVMQAIQRAGGQPFIARKTDEGVKIEHG